MTRWKRMVGAAVAVTLSGALAYAGGLGTFAIPHPTSPESLPVLTVEPDVVGRAFLDTYVEDGRVVRHDQGGDTVSEGQAYGMLIAAGIGDRDSFDAIWQWTSAHLQRPDGLLSWHWSDGAVVDAGPASDADLDAARALIVAGQAFGDDGYTADGVRLASAIADQLTVETGAGRILLPGSWADEGDTFAYNPSYASPAAFSVLSAATDDPRWAELAAGSSAVTTALLGDSDLPADWATVTASGGVSARAGADGLGDTEVYGYDAARLPIRYAESCSDEDRTLAAQLTGTLPSDTRDVATVMQLDGAVVAGDQHPLANLARSAARAAAGDVEGAQDDLSEAHLLGLARPTYYGSAWVALAALMSQTDTLGGCPTLPGAGHAE